MIHILSVLSSFSWPWFWKNMSASSRKYCWFCRFSPCFLFILVFIWLQSLLLSSSIIFFVSTLLFLWFLHGWSGVRKAPQLCNGWRGCTSRFQKSSEEQPLSLYCAFKRPQEKDSWRLCLVWKIDNIASNDNNIALPTTIWLALQQLTMHVKENVFLDYFVSFCI